MEQTNIKNRTLFIYDNLRVMRGMNSNSIDLIATDPPFNAKRSFNAPLGTRSAKQKFDDKWRWDEVTDEWHDLIAADYQAIKEIIEAAAVIEGGSIDRLTGHIDTGRTKNSIAAFLAWMAPRLIEMRRILKDTGSIYLHCDPASSHYLKLLMDAVFGRSNFRNEIVWKRGSGRSDGLRFGRVHDVILFYTKSKKYTYHNQYKKVDDEYLKKFNQKDNRGKYQKISLTGPGVSNGESGKEWNGWDPTSIGRCWSAPKTGKYAQWINDNIIPGYNDIKGIHNRLDALQKEDMVYWSVNNSPTLKHYVDAFPGVKINDIFDDIRGISPVSNERTGWATQKPLKLYECIIKASSDEGDMVLDPFAGCATTCVSAELLSRKWIGIDIDPVAETVTKDRLFNVSGISQMIDDNFVKIRKSPPTRQDIEKTTNDKMRVLLWNKQGRQCANPYCSLKEVVRPEDLDLDHVIPKSRGGSDDMENRIGLCGNCNKRKFNKAWGRFLNEERSQLAHPVVG